MTAAENMCTPCRLDYFFGAEANNTSQVNHRTTISNKYQQQRKQHQQQQQQQRQQHQQQSITDFGSRFWIRLWIADRQDGICWRRFRMPMVWPCWGRRLRHGRHQLPHLHRWGPFLPQRCLWRPRFESFPRAKARSDFLHAPPGTDARRVTGDCKLPWTCIPYKEVGSF